MADMHPITELVSDHEILLCALLSWFVAQALKIFTNLLVTHELDFRKIVGSGGMPSSHSAFVVSMAIMIGMVEGWGSSIFALSFTFAAVVMYDAAGVRRETGKQGEAINKILQNVFVDGKQITDDNLKELVGHKPIEVLAGALVGVIMALLFIYF